MKKYVLHPGTVVSQCDGDIHYVDSVRLADLYGVRLYECVTWDHRTMTRQDGQIHLYPRDDGDYRLPSN
jgi:hypothetical protein